MNLSDYRIKILLAVAYGYKCTYAYDDKRAPDAMRDIFRLLIAHGDYPVCTLCHRAITRPDDFSFDHRVPHSHGGSNLLHNMDPAHRECNMAKGNAVTDTDIQEICKDGADTPTEILERKKKRKSYGQKKRNVIKIKPWEIDDYQK